MSSFTRDNADQEYYSGHPAPPYNLILNDPSGQPLNLGAMPTSQIGLTLINVDGAPTIEGTGVWSIRDASTGKVRYVWSDADLATSGLYRAYVTALIPGDTSSRVFGPDLVVIHPAIGGYLMSDVNITQVLGTAISPSNAVPVSEADGASVTIGAKADAAYAGSGAASVIALLKSLYNSLQPARVRVAPWASNLGSTVATTDYLFKFGAAGNTPVQAILLQNNSGSAINYNIDSAAGPATFTLQDKQTASLDIGGPISVLHLYTSGVVAVNHATTPGIMVEGWA